MGGVVEWNYVITDSGRLVWYLSSWTYYCWYSIAIRGWEVAEQCTWEYFEESHVLAIKRISLCDLNHEDRMIWKFNNDGIYSVRSACHLFMNKFARVERLAVPGNWNRLWNWNLNIISHQKWSLLSESRVCRECFLTRVNLKSKGIECDGLCLFCANNFENAWHALIGCPYAETISKEAGLWRKLRISCWAVMELLIFSSLYVVSRWIRLTFVYKTCVNCIKLLQFMVIL